VRILVPEQWAGHARRVLEVQYSEEDMDWDDEEPQDQKKGDSTE
jgi:hypothetical protein